MFYRWSVNNGVWIVQNGVVINMPVYDDPDYAWKQMMKEKGDCDPYDEILKEFIDKLKETEDKLRKINNEQCYDYVDSCYWRVRL